MQQQCSSLLAGKRAAHIRIGTLIVILLICGVPSLAIAQDATGPDSGDTAWMLTSTALVPLYDHPWTRALLWRLSTRPKCTLCTHAMFCIDRVDYNRLDNLRL